MLAVMLASLAGAAILIGSIVAIQQARIAHERYEDVRKLATTFVFDVEAAARDVPGSMRVRRLITHTGLDYLNRLAANSARDWALKRELAAAYLRIAMVQGGTGTSNLGDQEGALNSFNSAGKLLDEIIHRSPKDRQAVLDRLSLYSEMANLQRDMAKTQEMASTARAGLTLAQTFGASEPNDLDVVHYAGILHLALARAGELRKDLDLAQSELAAGAPLLQRIVKARPDNREAQISFADALGRQGSIQISLGLTQDALTSFRKQATVLNAVCTRFPSDPVPRHELMLAYSHIGDVLDNPEYKNAGNHAGALEAYRSMVATAKFLHDADQADARAAMDYGIALLRLSSIVSAGEGKRAILTHSHELLTQVMEQNSQNMVAASYKTWVESELAAFSLTAGDRPASLRYYRLAIKTAETALRHASDPSTQKGLMVAARELAEEQARTGARSDALETLEHGLRMAEEVDQSAPQTSLLRVNVARTWQAAGSVYSILSREESGQQAAEDRNAARLWFQRALDQWNKLEPQKGFQGQYRKEMEATKDALNKLP
jgi:hypothetical protein